jgi:hypothetical protein
MTHGTNVVAVEVVYAHAEQPTYTLTLSGNPELEEGSPATGGSKRSAVNVSTVVDESKRAGLYRVDRVEFYAFSGVLILYNKNDLHLDDWPVLSINQENVDMQDIVVS